MIKTKATNPVLKETLLELEKQAKKENAKIWLKVGNILSKSRKNRVAVNLMKIDKYAKEGETIVVPGKVLGTGNLTKKVIVSSFEISDKAKQKINGVGTFMDLKSLMEKNPKGKGLKILR